MLTGINTIDKLNYENKVVFMRVDFNVPLDEQQNITDDTRIHAALPSIQFVRDTGAKLVLASHLGRPKGKRDPKFSILPVAQRLADILKCEIITPDDFYGEEVKKLISDMRPGQLMLLENLRFDPGEKSGDPNFASGLASLADLYIDDAFGAAHRKHASVYTMVQHFHRNNKAAGMLLHKELEALSKLLKSPKKPFIAVMGGSKVSDKIGVIKSLLNKADAILIGGAMAYTFLKAQGHEIGTSMVEEDQLQTALDALDQAKNLRKQLLLPVDHLCAPNFNTHEASELATTNSVNIPANQMGLDIGPKTITLYQDIINQAGTIFWNGPMGVFENPLFSKGTMAIANAIADSSSAEYTVVGGGDSVAALSASGKYDSISHVSTGGGASLQLIEGEPLPGIEALRANHPFK